jgi:putative ABC transport system permease protein
VNLSEEHINFIIKDLHHRGIVVDGIQEELVDHVCSAVESKMKNGMRFAESYKEVVEEFGQEPGLLNTQVQVIQSQNKTTSIMLRNHFMIALRNFRKHSFYTFINILGLAVGIASCVIIVGYVSDELSFDKHHQDAERIYRVDCEVKFGPNHMRLAVTPGPLAEAFRNDYPEVEAIGRFWNDGSMLVKRVDQNIKETRAIFADSSIFRVFTIPFVQGNPKEALREPFTMVLSRSAAEKYFPNEDPLNQTLILENKDAYKIIGVYKDMPTSSHFRFDMMMALVSNPYHKDVNWLSNNFTTYLKLGPAATKESLEAKFPQMVDKYCGPQAKAALGGDFTMEQFRASGNKIEYTLRPLTDIHLYSDMIAELGTNSDITYVYLFSAIALFILIIACINFMNLSTARSANRAKEVGVRKVMGSLRGHLVRQFLTESVILSLISFVLALGIAWLALPGFNELAGKKLTLPLGSTLFWLQLAIASVTVGIIAGVYPAFFLSAFQPVNVLKGNLALGMKSGIVRSALVVFQFFISIVLIIGTIAVNSQLNFIQEKKIGFNKDQVIIIKDAYGLGDQLQSFKEEALKNSRILSGTISGFLPVTGTNRSDNTFWPEGVQPTQENLVSLQAWRVDHDYVKTLGMTIRDGRDFSREFRSDTAAVILNQSALNLFGITENPVGKSILTWGGNNAGGEIDPTNFEKYTIIGVMEDFHFESLRQSIAPLGVFLRRSSGLISFRFQAENTQEVIRGLETTWSRIAPGMPFAYSFLDEDFGAMYSAEQRLGTIFTLFAGLAIVIACLGLFALTAFTAEQRTKEIGIRKVMGASVASIVMLLSKEFGRLIIIAFLIAVPTAWFGISKWLDTYTYRTEIGVLIYLAAGVIAFLIAWLTMGYQSLRAATSDPVRSLRSE